MRISLSINSGYSVQRDFANLVKGDTSKLASRQIDNVEDVNYKGTKESHRVSFQYDKDLGRNIAHVIDNSTGKTVKQMPSETQVDHMIRMQRLIGLHVDEKA